MPESFQWKITDAFLTIRMIPLENWVVGNTQYFLAKYLRDSFWNCAFCVSPLHEQGLSFDLRLQDYSSWGLGVQHSQLAQLIH